MRSWRPSPPSEPEIGAADVRWGDGLRPEEWQVLERQ